MERTSIATLAHELAAANEVAETVNVIPGDVMDIELLGRVDVIRLAAAQTVSMASRSIDGSRQAGGFLGAGTANTPAVPPPPSSAPDLRRTVPTILFVGGEDC